MGLMWGRAHGYKYTRYFVYVCIGKYRVPIFRWRIKLAKERTHD